MFALGAIHAGLAVAVLVSMQAADCAGLGSAVFGPEFTKAYNTPTEREKKALEEQQQKQKDQVEIGERLQKAYSEENIRKGKNMDFTDMDKAAALTSDPLVVAWKYGMLMAAGKTGEAAQIAERVENMYKDFGTVPGEPTAKAKQLDATAYTTMRILQSMDPNDPNRAAVKDDMCKQYRTLFSIDSGYRPESISSLRQDAQKAGCP